MRPFLTILIALWAGSLCTGRLAAQDAAAGRAVYEWICMPCHGPEAEGQQALQAPSLRLQQDWYLQAQLEKFRAGLRGAHRDDFTGSPMQLTATSLDDQKIADVVAYIVSLGQKGLPPSQHSLTGDVEHGKELYATCAACHGADARGNPAQRTPGLAGQWDWYLARQIVKFRDRIRGGDPRDVYGMQMAPFAQLLPDDAAVRDVAVYIRSLPAPQEAQLPTEPDVHNGAREFVLCASCHGEQGQGNATFHAPFLAGQGTWYVVRQLQNFRRGVRGAEPVDVFGTQMRALMANVDDQTMLDLAGHIAALPPPPQVPVGTVADADLELGARTFRKTCAPCHGQKGEGNRVLSAPALAGQNIAYLVRQLDAFRSGLRGADRRDPPGRIMRAWAGSLADQREVHSVAAHIAGLEPVHADDRLAPGTAVVPLAGRPPAVGPDPETPRAWPKGLLSPGGAANGSAKNDVAAAAPAAPVTAPAEPVAQAPADLPAADAPPTGEALFATCVGCHGTAAQGNPALHAPVLAGLGAWYVTEQLRKFRAGWRGTHPLDAAGSSMRPMAATLVDEAAIKLVADHVGALPPAEPQPATLAGKAARGAPLYAACAGCHGVDGRGNEGLRAPPLAYQADWYLATQLRNFKAGARGAHPADTAGAMMRPMAAGLANEAAIADVVAYIGTLRAGPAPAKDGAAAGAAEPEAGAGAAAAKGGAEQGRAADGGAADGGAADEEEDEEAEDGAAASDTQPIPDGDAARGQVLFATCIACHGADGRGNVTLQAPQIAGQEPWYIVTQLQHFKAGIRGAHAQDVSGQQMRPMAMTLIDVQAMADVAAHAHGLAPGAGKVTLGGDPARGQTLYTTCIACHGPDAKGLMALKAPSLAGQEDWYLVKQLLNFRAGIRGAHPQDVTGALMRPMALALTDEQAVKDVAAYLATRPNAPAGR